jgi:hypothetical protein
MFRPAEEMHMVRHDDVTTNRPTMTFACAFPFRRSTSIQQELRDQKIACSRHSKTAWR